jgi:hypothetical protein
MDDVPWKLPQLGMIANLVKRSNLNLTDTASEAMENIYFGTRNFISSAETFLSILLR